MFHTTQFPPAALARPVTPFAGQKSVATRPAEVRFDGWFGSRNSKLAKYIDQTLLMYPEGANPDEAIRKLCAEARTNHFCAVCVRPDKVKLAKENLRGSGVKIATVVGFPDKKSKLWDEKAQLTTGDVKPFWKIMETRNAIRDGADEIDLVMNVNQFLNEVDQPQQLQTLREFQLIRSLCEGKKLKIIIETDLLTPDEIRKATLLCAKAGADMVKTSTGMIDGGHGATVEDVKLIHDTLESIGKAGKIGIKASGGVKTAEGANALIHAGATRLGTSSGVAIVQGDPKKETGKQNGGY